MPTNPTNNNKADPHHSDKEFPTEHVSDISTEIDKEITIIGTGPVGLITAITLARSGMHSITLLGPKPTNKQLEGDTRTTAFMHPSVTMLKNCGIWHLCNKNAAPLKQLVMIDDCGTLMRAPDCHFSAAEIGLESFARNIPNRDLNQTLMKLLSDHDQVNWVETKAVTKITPAPDHIIITTAEGETYRSHIAIGADGQNSICRKTAGMKTKQWVYDQSAIACSFTHSLPHNATSTEIHRQTGPMTLIPLDEHHSSLVWSLTPDQAEEIVKLSDTEFSQKLYECSHAILGDITSVEKRVIFPIKGLSVDQFAAKRIFLVGEAAHVLPPIGAQGLNLGMKDIAALTECLQKHPDLKTELASLEMSYNQARGRDTQNRSFAIDMLNKSLLSSFLPLKAARTTGLNLLNNIKPLRQMVMNMGLGQESNLPKLMQPELIQTEHMQKE